MKCGHLLNQNRTNNGYGLQSTGIQGKLLVSMLEAGIVLVLKDYRESLPAVYRQCAVCYTDFWAAYNKVLPTKRHHAVGKESGKTNHIERFNLTMRQRISRLVRKTLSFSKKMKNHIGAIWNFVHHYNLDIAPKLCKITTS